MAICQQCKQEYSEARRTLGFTTCPQCGDKDALDEALQKQSRVGVVGNKGGYEYLGSPEQTKHLLLTAGSRKNIPLENTSINSHSLAGSYQRPIKRKHWQFSHWEFYYNPLTKRRETRAVLVEVNKESDEP